MAEELPNLFDAVRKANREVWEQASGRKSRGKSDEVPQPTGRESPLEGADAIVMVAALSAKLSELQARVDYIEDDYPESENGVGGDTEGGAWSGRVLDLHGTVIFELDPEASPPVVIGNVYLLIDTTKEGEDAVSFSSFVGAVPRYITYEVGVSDGAGGYTKKSGYVCGDIRVPLILGGDEFSVLTQTEGTGGIDMGYLRAIGGSVP